MPRSSLNERSHWTVTILPRTTRNDVMDLGVQEKRIVPRTDQESSSSPYVQYLTFLAHYLGNKENSSMEV